MIIAITHDLNTKQKQHSYFFNKQHIYIHTLQTHTTHTSVYKKVVVNPKINQKKKFIYTKPKRDCSSKKKKKKEEEEEEEKEKEKRKKPKRENLLCD